MNQRLKYLFEQRLSDNMTDAEWYELLDLRQELPKEEFIQLLTHYLEINPEYLDRDDEAWDKQLQLIVNIDNYPDSVRPVHRIHFLRTAWFRYAAAVIAIAGISSYLWLSREKQPVLTATTATQSIASGIVPGTNKAILTLADGSKVILDNAAANNITSQGATNIVKIDANQLAYNQDPSTSLRMDKESINTVSTPKGSQYQVILPDGSKVWLNAASSITYPTAFMEGKREVSVTGEIYFEVKSNKTQPFVVIAKGTTIQVLGTSFNVQAYDDETAVKTSLLEGAVKVNATFLKPGQACVNGQVTETDLEQDIAWKKGIFNFNGLSLEAAMNQLARWYDVEIVYQGQLPPFHFYGELWRDVPLADVLKRFSEMEGIRFRAAGKTIVVSAAP